MAKCSIIIEEELSFSHIRKMLWGYHFEVWDDKMFLKKKKKTPSRTLLKWLLPWVVSRSQLNSRVSITKGRKSLALASELLPNVLQETRSADWPTFKSTNHCILFSWRKNIWNRWTARTAVEEIGVQCAWSESSYLTELSEYGRSLSHSNAAESDTEVLEEVLLVSTVRGSNNKPVSRSAELSLPQ